MAKKKKRRAPPVSGRRPATTTATAPSQKARAHVADRRPEAIKPAAATEGGPSRVVRKEEARRQREVVRRKMARRRVVRRGGVVSVAVVVVGLVAFFAIRSNKPATANPAQRRLLQQAPRAAAAAGCGAIQTVGPYQGAGNNQDNDRAHITGQPPPLSSYRTTPPASGPHNPTPLDAGVYQNPPDIYMTIHSLEHGAVIVWYNPSTASTSELTRIQSWFRQPQDSDHVIVAPYNYPDQETAGQLPAGKQMVLVAWHRMQVCNQVSLPVAFSFYWNLGAAPNHPYKGEAPEAGGAI
jgi:hypothetical protein